MEESNSADITINSDPPGSSNSSSSSSLGKSITSVSTAAVTSGNESRGDDNSSQSPVITPPLSKRQQKKLARKQKWQEQKAQRKREEKERKKLKRKEAIERGEDVGPVRKYVKNIKMKESPCQIRIAIDFSLDNLMTEAERIKAYHQLQRCYSVNRRAKAPLQLYFSSFVGYSETKAKTIPGYTQWDIYRCEESFLDLFSKDEIVYLTSESPNTLMELKESEVYIIGGLVDHNRCKGICYQKAQEYGIRHAKLPLDDYIVMKTRKVLTIDQVFEILLKVSEGLDWATAFLSVIPGRKGATHRTGSSERNDVPSENNECSVNNSEEEETSSVNET